MNDIADTQSPVTVRLASPIDRARWNGYVDREPSASIYHRYEWGEIFDAVYGKPFIPLIAEQAGRVVGVLPIVSLHRGPRPAEWVSLPYFGHAGAVAESETAWHALINHAAALGRERGVRHVELRHGHPIPANTLPSRDDKVLMHLALPSDIEELNKSVGSKLRNDIKKPQREGMTAEIGGAELLSEFHGAYASVMRDLGSPCHSRALFAETMARFPDRTFIVRVVYEGRTAGAAFLIGQGDVLEVPCAGTLHSLNKLRPNMLLYWSVFRAAIERGYKTFSFGRSTIDAGTYNFKKQWGSVPVALPYTYLLREGEAAPGSLGASTRLQQVSDLWTKLPLPLANFLGPQLVRHLP